MYTEKKDKLILKLSDSDKLVKIKVDCCYGTIVTIKFTSGSRKTVECGEICTIGKASDLKGKKIRFTGVAKNPDGEEVKITHTFYEVGGKRKTYTFPGGYTGQPEFNNADEFPDYRFYLNLR